jgi:hypothetical protein
MERDRQMQEWFSPFAQSYTPHQPPLDDSLKDDAFKLESPLTHNHNFMSPPPSFPLLPISVVGMQGQYGLNHIVDNLTLGAPQMNRSNSSHGQSYAIDNQPNPITPGQLLQIGEQNYKDTDYKRREVLPRYQMDGEYSSSSVTAVKKSHKEAEQKRRDVLKNAFKKCQSVLPRVKEKSQSRVQILGRARRTILDLSNERDQQQKYIDQLLEYIRKGNSNNPVPVYSLKPLVHEELSDCDE